MLVTISGMVGSGKTTAANHVRRLAENEGVRATCWRFQSLPCFRFLQAGDRGAAPHAEQAQSGRAARWSDYRRRPLTARVALGYVVRILAFRLFRRWRGSQEVQVSNRYFYDSFVHYELKTPAERLYATLLQRLVPAPDLAILLMASPETITARRPQYAREYLSSVGQAYRNLRLRFPQLIEISTDPDQPTVEHLEALVREHVAPRGPRQR